MSKIIIWLKESNRWKHLIGGLMLGLLSLDLYSTSLLSISVASALELKDKQYGGKWDWIDWIITIISTFVGFFIKWLLT